MHNTIQAYIEMTAHMSCTCEIQTVFAPASCAQKLKFDFQLSQVALEITKDVQSD